MTMHYNEGKEMVGTSALCLYSDITQTTFSGPPVVIVLLLWRTTIVCINFDETLSTIALLYTNDR